MSPIKKTGPKRKPPEPEKKTDYQSKDYETQYKEWEKTREFFKEYDTRLHELRKYGFSFVTALLTVGSFATNIISQGISSEAANITASASIETEIPAPALFNLGVFIVTLLLIVAIHLFDKNYRVFQEAAYIRAVVIERKLNMELTDAIAARHRRGRIALNIFFVYSLFILGVAVIGCVILNPQWNLIFWLIGCSCLAWVVIICQSVALRIKFNNDENLDWTVSPLECYSDDTIRITLNIFEKSKNPFTQFFRSIVETILGEKESEEIPRIIFPGKTVMWEINDKDGNKQYDFTVPDKTPLTVYKNYVWIVKPGEFTDKGKNGPYKIKPIKWKTPLPISIIVH